MDSSSLARKTSWLVSGSFVYRLCQWGMLTVLAKLGSPEMVGEFALGLAVCAPVFEFTNMQLREILATDASNEYRPLEFLAFRAMTTTVGFLIVAGLCLSNLFGQSGQIILVVGVAKVFETGSDILYGFQQKVGIMERIAASLVLRGVLSLGVLAWGIAFRGDLLQSLIWVAAVWLGLLIFFDYPNTRRLLVADNSPRATPLESKAGPTERLSRLFRQVIPLGFTMLLLSLRANIPRYFIEACLGLKELGIYSAMVYVQVAGVQVIHALGRATNPQIARLYYSGQWTRLRALILKLISGTVLVGLIGVAVACLAGGPILTLLYSAEFAAYSTDFILIMIAAVGMFLSVILHYPLAAIRLLRVQLSITVVTVLVVAIGSALLVPRFGLTGAITALMVSAYIQALFSAAVLLHAWRRAQRSTGGEGPTGA